MKKRMVLIYILLCFALGLQFGFSGGRAIRDFERGWNSVGSNNDAQEYVMLDVYLKPDTAHMPTDSLYNKKSNTWMPAQIRSASVGIADEGMPWVSGLAKGIVKIILFVVLMVLFFKLMIEVGLSRVFVWKNVKLLRLIGLILILVSVMDYIEFKYAVESFRAMIEIPGYIVSGNRLFNFMNLILGLAAFLIAEVFAIGLKLKEEQDLTI